MNWILRHPLRKFVVFFTGAYIFLVGITPLLGLHTGYSNFARGLGNTLYSEFRGKGLTKFTEGDVELGEDLNTMIILVNKEQDQAAARSGTQVDSAQVYFSPWRSGYLPMALLFALIIASPVPRRRKYFALGWGLLISTLFLIFRMWLIIMENYQANENLQVVDKSGFPDGMVHGLHLIFVSNVVVSTIFPVLVWILVTFRREDYRLISDWVKTATSRQNPDPEG